MSCREMKDFFTGFTTWKIQLFFIPHINNGYKVNLNLTIIEILSVWVFISSKKDRKEIKIKK